MSMESANPKVYTSHRDATEDKLETEFKSLELHRLHPDQYKDVCSCSDCDRKITRLRGLETNILFLSTLKWIHLGNFQDIESLCDNLYYQAGQSKMTLDSIRKYLKTVCEDGGLSFTLPKSSATCKFEIVYQQIERMLVSADVIDDPSQESEETIDHGDLRLFDLSHDIHRLMFWYGHFKANKEAAPLFKQILEIEQNNEAEIEKTNPNFSILKVNTERQIEKFEMIPNELLEQEVKELLELITPRIDHYLMFRKVRNYVDDIDAALRMERDKFWANNNKLVNGHSSNSLDKTLDSFIEKVNSFETKWETEFASFYTTSSLPLVYERQVT